MKLTLAIIAGIAAVIGIVWYIFIRKEKPEATPAPAPEPVIAITPMSAEIVPTMTPINHAVVGEVIVPAAKPYIGEPVVPAPAVKAMVETAIINAIAVTPITTGHGGLDAAAQIVNMNMMGVDPNTGKCTAMYEMNPFGICQPIHNINLNTGVIEINCEEPPCEVSGLCQSSRPDGTHYLRAPTAAEHEDAVKWRAACQGYISPYAMMG